MSSGDGALVDCSITATGGKSSMPPTRLEGSRLLVTECDSSITLTGGKRSMPPSVLPEVADALLAPASIVAIEEPAELPKPICQCLKSNTMPMDMTTMREPVVTHLTAMRRKE